MNFIRKTIFALAAYLASRDICLADSPPTPLELYGPYISQNEGFRTSPYQDTLGHWTVGVGHRLRVHEAVRVYTSAEVGDLFQRDLLVAVDDAKKLVPNFDRLPLEARQVIVDLSFQLGYPGLKKFRGFLAKVNYSLYRAAAAELEFTKYEDDCPKRALRNILQLRRLSS